MLDDIGLFDTDRSSENFERVTQSARLAPEHFTPELVQYVFGLARGQPRFAEAALIILDAVGADDSDILTLATAMLRRGYPVYIVDFPRRGRASYPSFNGPFGTLAGSPVVANRTGQAGLHYAWSRWRLGPKYPEVFPVQQFPMKGLDQFMLHLVPTV